MTVSPEATSTNRPDNQAPLRNSRSTAKKPYRCRFCQRNFARHEHLQRHERLHTKETPFRCSRCPRSFSRNDLLARHERLFHDVQSGGNHPRHRGSIAHIGVNQQERHNENNVENGDIDSPRSPLNEAPTNEECPQQPSPQTNEHTMVTMLPNAPSCPAHRLPEMIGTIPTNEFAEPLKSQQIQETTDHLSGGVSIDTSNMLPTFMADIGNIDYSNPYVDFMSFLDSAGIPQQPIPYFSPDPIFDIPQSSNYVQHDSNIEAAEDSTELTDDIDNFSRSGCRLPSLQPEPNAESSPSSPSSSLWDVTWEDRARLVSKLEEFKIVIPPGFALPSRHALSRYFLGYVKGFHDYLPFLHIPSLSITKSAPELILAIAGLGSRYCIEPEKSTQLFHVAKAVAMEQIRRRDERWANRLSGGLRSGSYYMSRADSSRESSYGLGEPTVVAPATEDDATKSTPTIEIAQALLLLMAMATWGANKALFREGLAIRSILATIIREDGLTGDSNIDREASWEDWIRIEGAKRTKFMVFCNFNFHCIVFNTPPLILAAEINMQLPCWEIEWNAKTASSWQVLRRTQRPEPAFQDSFQRLFTNSPGGNGGGCSSLGNYVLVHALIQHTFLLRQIHQFQTGSDRSLPASQVATLEKALKNWQYLWETNPESSLDPLDPHGPVAFNSTALLRMAYIRLSMDIGPGRALDTQDPVLIARAIWESPPIKRNRKVTRAVLHSAHALSIPVKLGVNLVARNQLFTRSIQHSLCSLECAFLLSKWLEAVSVYPLHPPLNEDERMLLALVTSLVNETEFSVPGGNDGESIHPSVRLSANMVRVWAKLFKSGPGNGIWDIVDLIGRALDVYADMLEAGRAF